MKRSCPKMKRTPERIECTELKGLCIHQYYKQCRGMYELTEKSAECPIRDWSKDDGKR